MSDIAVNIERVVREVLAELGILGDCPDFRVNENGTVPLGPRSVLEAEGGERRAESEVDKTVSSDDSLAPRPSPLPPASGDLNIDSRVVTMNEVAGRLDSVRRLVVSREAVVTPAVRDELLRRGITLAQTASSSSCPAAPARLVVITMGTDFDPAALTAGLTREGLTVEHSTSDCLIAATGQLAAETAKPDTLGLLLTRHTAAGLCLANRLGGVRAVTGADVPAVAAAAAAVGANVLVANPQAGTFFQLKQMATEFCRCGVRPCPAVFRGQLT